MSQCKCQTELQRADRESSIRNRSIESYQQEMDRAFHVPDNGLSRKIFNRYVTAAWAGYR
jgi:hypothetical protein